MATWNWLKARWSAACMIGIVTTSVLFSVVWALLLPINQGPDEADHLDYALAIAENGLLCFRKHGGAIPKRFNNGYVVHPYSQHLLKYVPPGYASPNLPSEYGTRAFFHKLDADSPRKSAVDTKHPPYLFKVYPFGYYGLLAGWIRLLRFGSQSLTILFFGARLLSPLLLAASLLLVYGTAREMDLTETLALILTACVGLLPLTSFVSAYVQPDNLAMFLVLLCYYLSFKVINTQQHPCLVCLLGTALAALLLTKSHTCLAVLLPCFALVTSELLFRRVPFRRSLFQLGILIGPSLAAVAFHLWLVSKTTHRLLPSTISHPAALCIATRFKKALLDYYTGYSHDTFWFLFGWADVHLRIFSPSVSSLMELLIQGMGWGTLALTLLRIEQVFSRLASVAIYGKSRYAMRIACSNVPVNSYLVFTIGMFYLYVRTDNGYVAQGRQWFAFLFPSILAAALFAPKALTLRRTQRACSRIILGCLLSYCLLGSYYGIKTLKHRYYPHRHSALVFDGTWPLKIGRSR